MHLQLRYLLLLALPGLVSCSHLPGQTPSGTQLVGTYDMGHAGFSETVELIADGTFTETLHPHLDNKTVTFKGDWELQGDHLSFRYRDGHGPTEPYLIRAETFYYRGKPAFVRTQNLKDHRVHEWWVFEKKVEKNQDDPNYSIKGNSHPLRGRLSP